MRDGFARALAPLLAAVLVASPVSAQQTGEPQWHDAPEIAPGARFPGFTVGSEWKIPAEQWFTRQLDELRQTPALRARLDPRERAILDRAELVIADTDQVGFAAEVRDPEADRITITSGGAFFIDAFARILADYEFTWDDGLIYHFLQSERARQRGGQRWFDPIRYHRLTGLPLVPDNPVTPVTIHSTTRVVGGFILLHELCHLFLGHDAAEFAGKTRAEQLPIRRAREIDADACAADHLMALQGNPQMGLAVGLAYAATEPPLESDHPSSAARRARVVGRGEAAVRHYLDIGFLTPKQAADGFKFLARFDAILARLDAEDLAAAEAEAAARAAAQGARDDAEDGEDPDDDGGA